MQTSDALGTQLRHTILLRFLLLAAKPDALSGRFQMDKMHKESGYLIPLLFAVTYKKF